MIRKLGLFFGFSLVSLAAATIMTNHKAFAYWCNVIGSPSNGSTSRSACTAGQNTANFMNLTSSGNLTNTFINDVNEDAASPYPVNKVGAAYIKDRLQARGGNWQDNVKALTLKLQNIPARYGCENTAYDPDKNAVVPDTADCVYDQALIMYDSKGNISFILRLECGNPIGNFSPPPAPPPNSPPVGAISIGCNADGTGKYSGWFYDPDGSTTARVSGGSGGGINPQTYTSGGGQTSYGNRKTFSFTNISVSHTRGTWTLTLVVQDKGGKLDKTYRDSHAQCNRVPTGGVTTASCTLIKGTARDPDTGVQLRIRFDIYRGDTDRLLKSDAGPSSVKTTSGASHTFSADPLTDFNNVFGGWQKIIVRTFARDANTGTYRELSYSVVAPCVGATCSTDFGGTVPVGTKQTFQVVMNMRNVNNSNGAVTGYGFNPNSAGVTFGVKVKDPDNQNVGLKTASGAAFDPSSNFSYSYPVGKRTGLNFMVNKSGTYVMNASLTVPGNRGGAAVNFSGCGGSSGVNLDAGYQPYFDVLSGDIAAGPGFGASCTPGASSDITGVLDTASSSSSGYYGAGTQLAALALGDITNFATSLNADGSGSGSGPPSGLAFANTTAGGSIYGGSYAKPTWCVPDYVTKALGAQGVSSSLDLTKSGTYHLTGNQTLGNITLVKGKRVTIVVTGGDVFIDGDIKYNTSYTTTEDIPQLQLLVQGNIYIQNTVRQLHGFYAAQPKANGSGGKLYTCATALGVPVIGSDKANDYNTCKHQLTVYGGVAADQLVLGRTYGSVAGSGAPASPAEQFIYVPELWLGDLTTPKDSSEPYQAFTSLPPIL